MDGEVRSWLVSLVNIISYGVEGALVFQHIASIHCRTSPLLLHLEPYDQHQCLSENRRTVSDGRVLLCIQESRLFRTFNNVRNNGNLQSLLTQDTSFHLQHSEELSGCGPELWCKLQVYSLMGNQTFHQLLQYCLML